MNKDFLISFLKGSIESMQATNYVSANGSIIEYSQELIEKNKYASVQFKMLLDCVNDGLFD